MSEPAVDILARWALHTAFETWTEGGWEDRLPAITERDYDRIVDRMTELLPPDVSLRNFQTAHKILAARAERSNG